MRFIMGKREKLIIGIVLMIGTIAALHLLLFKPLSDVIDKKEKEFAKTKAEIGQIAVKQSDAGKVKKFMDEIETMVATYDTVNSSLVFNTSKDTIQLNGKNHYLVANEMPVFLEKVAELEALQGNSDEIEIELLEKLKIVRTPRGINEDKIYANLNDLESKMKLLKDANLNDGLKNKLEEEKAKLRKLLGFDDAELKKLGKRKRMMREYTALDYLDKKLHESGEAIPLASLAKRLDISPLEVNDFKLLIEQMNIIADVTKLAMETQMDRVNEVDIFKSDFLAKASYLNKQKEAAAEAAKKAEEAAKTGMGAGMMPGGMMMDPAMMGMPMDGGRRGAPAGAMMGPGMMGGRDPTIMIAVREISSGKKTIDDFPANKHIAIKNAMTMMNMGGGAAGMLTGPDPNAPVPPEERLALNLPITISVKGNSRSFINFLYRLSFAPRIHEIDRFDLKVDNEGLVELNFRINTYTNINGVNWDPKAEEAKKAS